MGTRRIIGLTGGIACGKSLVAQALRDLQVPVIDLDQIARDCLQPNTPAYRAVIDHFGPAYLNSDHTLNRAALRKRIFQDLAAKVWLEALLHPLIHQICLERLRSLSADQPYVVLDIPLLLESQLPYPVDQIWVVDCEPEQQISRLVARDGISPVLAKRMVEQQTARSTRLARASVVLYNQGRPKELFEQVRLIHQKTLNETG